MSCPNRVALSLLPVCLCFAMLAPPGFATVILPADFGAMVAESQTIVHGVVTATIPQMPAGRRSIETVVTIQIRTALKGPGSGSVVFRVPNGRFGRYRRITVGAPELAPGDEVVVFLKGHPPGMPMPYGLSQGVYRVVRGAGGQALVTPLLPADPGRVVRGDPARRPLSIDAFAERVRAMVAR